MFLNYRFTYSQNSGLDSRLPHSNQTSLKQSIESSLKLRVNLKENKNNASQVESKASLNLWQIIDVFEITYGQLQNYR